MRWWIYRNVIFLFPTIFGGGDNIVTLYFHPWQYLVRGGRGGGGISWHYIFTPDNIWWAGDYIVTQYSHPWQYFVRGWLYCDIIFSLPRILTIFREGVIISWHNIFTHASIWSGGDYIVTLYFRPWQYWWGGDYIGTSYFHSWQYFVRGWLHHNMIFSPLPIFGQGVIILWHYIFAPGNIWCGGDHILTYFHSWQYLVRGWIYRDIIFSLLIIFGEGLIISWHYILTPGNIWWGDDYIVTLYFQSWQYLVRGWLYRDIFHSWRWLSWYYIIISDTALESVTGGDYIWILSVSKFNSAVIPGFYHS